MYNCDTRSEIQMSTYAKEFFDKYYEKLKELTEKGYLEGSFLPPNSSLIDKRLELIIRTCQDLDQMHLFTDGNIRTIAFLVMNKMLIENGFNPTYETIKGKKKVITELQKDAKNCDKVYLASDPDREGEAIAWHLKDALGLKDKDYERVVFNEITKESFPFKSC